MEINVNGRAGLETVNLGRTFSGVKEELGDKGPKKESLNRQKTFFSYVQSFKSIS